MASISYNFLNPEPFNTFVPEVVFQERNRQFEETLLWISVTIILAGVCYVAYQYWQERQDEIRQS